MILPSTLCHWLAVERCKHSLAQLSAVAYLLQEDSRDNDYCQTIQLLVAGLNRDLSYIQDHLGEEAMVEDSRAA